MSMDHLSYKVDGTKIIANTHLAYPDLASDKFSGTDSDQDAESFVQPIEREINFTLGDAPADLDDLATYTFRKKALFSSLLRGPAAEWYENNIDNATTWAATREQIITRFFDGRSKFRHKQEIKHCVRGDGEEIRAFLHRIKKIVDKGWPDAIEDITEGDRAAKLRAQGGQRRQRYIDYIPRRLRPRHLQRKAQEYLNENPNATWDDFSTRIIQKDVSYQVSSNFLNDEEQTKVHLASLVQQMKHLRSEIQKRRVDALENSRQPDPNQKGRQNAARFCNYCRTNGHTPSLCGNKIRDEQIKRLQNGLMAVKYLTFTNDYNKHRGLRHGYGQFNYNNTGSRKEIRRVITDEQQSTYPRNTWVNHARNNSFSSGRGRSFNRFQNQFAKRNDDNYHRNGSTGIAMTGSWQNIETNPRSPSGPRRDPQPSRQYQPSRSSTPDNSELRQSNSHESSGFVPYEQRFPQTNDQPSSHAVRFTTTDDSINQSSDFWPPVNLMNSPKSGSSRSRSSRLSFNIIYFATGDAQKDSGLEIEVTLDTGASCSINLYRTFWEISKFQHPIMVRRSYKLTKTYSGQEVPMIAYATREFS